ncbi:MAG TPA: NADH-quinone oxidoreductase subunit C [Xanthomonadaceae bacterium]|nr:NADH-quinone oxidoreductase subunit C [Xanthomonadaceae bacterium]
MAEDRSTLAGMLRARFESKLASVKVVRGETTIELAPESWLEVARALREEPEFDFEQLVDVCGVDYLGYGDSEWDVADVTTEGYSRGVEGLGPGRLAEGLAPSAQVPERRYAVVAHLLSLRHNRRLRMRCFADSAFPLVPSLVEVWASANWFEREAFDLFGIVFEGHPDLRRILTDYGFIGHPFRKDFPLIGNVEVRYDPEKARVVYEPVSIEPRVLVPRVIRDDSRYEQAQAEQAADGSGS